MSKAVEENARHRHPDDFDEGDAHDDPAADEKLKRVEVEKFGKDGMRYLIRHVKRCPD